MVVTAKAVLFAVFVSVSLATTLAVLVIVPASEGTTTRVAVALPRLVRVPKLQLIRPLPRLLHVPCDAVAEAKVTRAGSESVSVTLVAGAGPAFVTVRG